MKQTWVSVERAIAADPLRAKYWKQGCPNQSSPDEYHLMAFRLVSPNSNSVKEVFCYDCGFREKASNQEGN